jgi:hypothetical protein
MPPKKTKAKLEWRNFKEERIRDYILSLGLDSDIAEGGRSAQIEWLEAHGVKAEVMLEFPGQISHANRSTTIGKQMEKIPLEGVRSGEDMLDFLIRFEGCVELLQIPEKNWVKMIYPKLLPNGQRMIQGLSQLEKADYKMVKARLEEFYRITPEKYREKLRAITKTDESYLEIVREMRTLICRWNKIGTDVYESEDRIRRVIDNVAIEQLMELMPSDLRQKFGEQVHIGNKSGKSLEDIAMIADMLDDLAKKADSDSENDWLEQNVLDFPPAMR